MKHIPVRSCIVCKESKDKSELLRIVLRADGTAVVDTTGREPGRGAYICKSAVCAEGLIKKQAISRSFKTALPRKVYDDLKAQLDGILQDGKD